MDEKKLLMVTVSGPDRPGITATLTRVLAEHQAEIVDIEQASLQNLLGLYFLLDLSGSGDSQDNVIKDLLFEASRMHLTLQFRLFAPEELQAVNQRNLSLCSRTLAGQRPWRPYQRYWLKRRQTSRASARRTITERDPWRWSST